VWVGMRPLTPDGLPIIGPLPGVPRVIAATGHAMLGVTLAPATGEAVADLITGAADPQALVRFTVIGPLRDLVNAVPEATSSR